MKGQKQTWKTTM